MYRLDSRIEKCFKMEGIKELRDIQKKALNAGLLKSESILVSSPSTSGKTVIGKIAVINKLISNIFSKAIYLVPIRSSIEEKKAMFRKACEVFHFNTYTYYDGKEIKKERITSSRLIISTYSGFSDLLQKKIGILDDVECVVIDDAQLIGSDTFGVMLEGIITRLKIQKPEIQIVVLSGKFSNAKEISEWLDFICVESDKRQVPIRISVRNDKNKIDLIKSLSSHIISRNGQVLVFTKSRKNAEDFTNKLKEFIKEYVSSKDLESIKDEMEELDKLKGLEREKEIYKELFNSGLAFYHSGIAYKFRESIEQLFRKGSLKMVICTTSFGSSITTPARLVLLTDISVESLDKKGRRLTKYLDPNTIHHIMDKAGRPGFDSQGFSIILVSTKEEKEEYTNQLFEINEYGELDPKYSTIISQLDTLEELKFQIILEASSKNGISRDNLDSFLSETLYYHQNRKKGLQIFSLLDSTISTAKGYLKKYSSDSIFEKAERTPLKDIKITNINEKSISGEIQSSSRKNVFHSCFFDLKKGASCECEYFRFKINGKEIKLCKHLIALGIKALESHQFSENAENVIPKSLGEESIIDHLVKNELIELKGDVLLATSLGQIIVDLNLDPCIILEIREEILKDKKRKTEDILKTILTSSHCSERIDYFVKSYSQPYKIILEYIEGVPIGKISINQKIYAGDIITIVSTTKKLVEAYRIVAGFLGKKELAKLAKKLLAEIDLREKNEDISFFS
ncbi:MAG: DEAD/DEAH box helicase [Candidatus Ranarchaeia archaeon]